MHNEASASATPPFIVAQLLVKILLVILINDESDVSMTPPLSPALLVVKPTAGDINKLMMNQMCP